MQERPAVLIDFGKCIGCGQCVRDCVSVNLCVEDGKARVLRPDCLMCAHCVAVCPVNAVSITGFPDPPAPIVDAHPIDPEKLLQALQARRSIRQFTREPVADEALQRIIEAGRFTPTASNSQSVSYLVVAHRMKAAESAAVAFMRKLQKPVGLVMRAYRDTVIDENFLFKGAPLAVVVLAPNNVDGALAASNMALMAEAQGLGVLYSGFFTIAANHSRAVRRALGLKRGERAAATLVIGHPAVHYARTAPKERAQVRDWVRSRFPE